MERAMSVEDKIRRAEENKKCLWEKRWKKAQKERKILNY